MPLELSILYRGPLSSCNYDCHYCPFAKRHETAEELAVDRRALQRFLSWVGDRREDTLSLFFTPWGEALTRKWYQTGLAELSRLPQIRRVAVQTNLSWNLDWLAGCDRDTLALWCTYHPSQVSRGEFLAQCGELARRGIRYSVGMVGLKEDLEEITALRRELPADIYLWINAYKRGPDYYTADDLHRLTEIDPQFPLNNQYHASLGRMCHTGDRVISVDGDGHIRRCHFIPDILGNIYLPGWETCLQPRHCTNHKCGCHIGYVHLDELNLYEVYGDGLLERIPHSLPALPR